MASTSGNTYKAGAGFVRISPYKVREVAAVIKGKHVDEARRILAFTPKAASREMSKILESAVANAEHNFQASQHELYVKLVCADEGATIKRLRPRAQGRGFRIRKRTSHIRLELERKEPVYSPRRPEARRRRSDETLAARAGSRAAGSSAAGKAPERPPKDRRPGGSDARRSSKPGEGN